MQLFTRAVAAATIITGIGVIGAAGTALADASCSARTTTAAFARWGDDNQYFVADGGTFERGVTEWNRRGLAGAAAGQNPLGIAGPGMRSMRLPGGSSVESPEICVFQNEESVRFAYRAPYAGAQLRVDISVESNGQRAATTTVVTAAGSGWDVSPIVDMPNLRNADGQQRIIITMRPLDLTGSWQVDDVMIDPWVAR